MQYKNLLFKAFLLLILTSCSTGKSPKDAAERFLNAFNEKNYDEARKYSSPETVKLVDLMENLSKMSTTPDTIEHAKIVMLDEKITGETAIVTFMEEGAEDTDELNLTKIDGKWLVHITKTDTTAKENSVFSTEEEGMMETDSSGFLQDDPTIDEELD